MLGNRGSSGEQCDTFVKAERPRSRGRAAYLGQEAGAVIAGNEKNADLFQEFLVFGMLVGPPAGVDRGPQQRLIAADNSDPNRIGKRRDRRLDGAVEYVADFEGPVIARAEQVERRGSRKRAHFVHWGRAPFEEEELDLVQGLGRQHLRHPEAEGLRCRSIHAVEDDIGARAPHDRGIAAGVETLARQSELSASEPFSGFKALGEGEAGEERFRSHMWSGGEDNLRTLAMPMLILASASPRRKELLAQAGFVFEVRPAQINEDARAGEDPISYVVRLAREKAEFVYSEESADQGTERREPPTTAESMKRDSALIVLGADTTVELDGKILGKPENEADAARMLRLLSGRTHRVITGVAVVTASGTHVASEVTGVRFLTLSDEEIASYVATGEPMDKAGAYAIQGFAARWVPRVTGCYFNVVGLPLALVSSMLETYGDLVPAS